jgi:hypothetical protein
VNRSRLKRLVALPAVLVGALALSSCGYNIPSDMTAVHVTKGPFQAKKVVGCVQPSERKFWTNDTYALFPTSEREWDATGQKGSDAKDFQSVTKDKVVMKIPVTVRFSLITDCDTLKQFYVKYARRYAVEFHNDGSYNDEWETLLRKLVADPSDQALDRIVQDYNWQDVWNNPQTKVEITDRLNKALQDENSLLVQTAKGQYFEGISVLVGTPRPSNPDLATAVASEQTKVAQAQADEAQAKADEAKAKAETAVAQAEAAKQQAIINGYGGIDGYLKFLAVQNGINPWQPSYGSALVNPNGQNKQQVAPSPSPTPTDPSSNTKTGYTGGGK